MSEFNPNAAYPTEWVYVTPELAEEWLGKNEGNRNKRKQHIAKLVRDLESGNFLPTGDSIKFDWNGRLIDGQHRLTSVISAGTAMWTIVVRNLDPRVRSVLDTNAKRSASDALYFEDVDGWRIVKASVAKIDMSRRNGRLQTSTDTGHVQPTNSEVLGWYNLNQDVDRAAELAGKFYKQIGCPPSALAYSILILARIDFEKCVEFFSSAAEMRTEGIGDPRLTMLRTFEKQSDYRRTTLSNAAAISIIFRSWNAWREGRELKKLPLSTRTGGIAIPEPQ